MCPRTLHSTMSKAHEVPVGGPSVLNRSLKAKSVPLPVGMQSDLRPTCAYYGVCCNVCANRRARDSVTEQGEGGSDTACCYSYL